MYGSYVKQASKCLFRLRYTRARAALLQTAVCVRSTPGYLFTPENFNINKDLRTTAVTLRRTLEPTRYCTTPYTLVGQVRLTPCII